MESPAVGVVDRLSELRGAKSHPSPPAAPPSKNISAGPFGNDKGRDEKHKVKEKKGKQDKKEKGILRLSTSKLPTITAPAIPLGAEDGWLEAYLARAMDVRQRLAQFRDDTRGLLARASGYLFELQLYDDVQQQEDAVRRDLAVHDAAFRELDASTKALIAQCFPPAGATSVARDCWSRALEHVAESLRIVKSEHFLAEGEIRRLLRERRRWILAATAPDLTEQKLQQILDSDNFEVFPSTQ